jgi:phosphonate transport system ATP-binding protein
MVEANTIAHPLGTNSAPRVIAASSIQLENVSHVYANGTQALFGIGLTLTSDRFTALIGPSGAGKSTLMRVLNGLVKPSSGRVTIFDTEITSAPAQIVRQKRREIGMVFQSFNLVKRLTALENVLLGRLGFMNLFNSSLQRYSKSDRELAMHLLDRVGLAEQAWQRADTLSGGQQQRVGIARALAQQPRLILADEPISALDPRSSDEVMAILRAIQREDNISVIANLHHLEAVRDFADRVIALKAGKLAFDGPVMALSGEITQALYYGEQHLERTHEAGSQSITANTASQAALASKVVQMQPARFKEEWE